MVLTSALRGQSTSDEKKSYKGKGNKGCGALLATLVILTVRCRMIAFTPSRLGGVGRRVGL